MRIGMSVLLLWAAPLWAGDKADLKAVQRELKSVEKKIRSDQGTREKNQQSLNKIERDIVERRTRQRLTTEKQAVIQADIAALDDKRQSAATQLSEKQSALKSWLRNSYQLSRQPRMKLLLSTENPADVSRMNQYYGYLARAQQQKMQGLMAAQAELDSLDQRLQLEQRTQAALAAVLEKDQAYLKQLKKNRQTTIAKLDKSIASAEAKAGELKAREKRLRQVLAQIAKRQAERQKARSAKKQSGQARGEIGDRVTRRDSSKRKMPVTAPVLARFGQKRPGSGERWTGVMLGAKAGAPVKAIDAGEVVYADWLNGYGQLLIIDHGGGLMSLYGHNAALLKREGERVSAQEVIAQVGDTAGLSKAALYFEVRHQGEPEDPLKWCSG